MSGEDQNRLVKSQHNRQKNNRKFRNFLIKVGLIYILISSGLFVLFAVLLEDHAYDDMSRDEVHHISQMVFESMYTAMVAGAGRQGIEAAAKRMEATGPGLITSVIRGETIARLFGDSEVDAMRRRNDLAIVGVFKKAEEAMIRKDQRIRFLYPAKFRDQCKQCHVNSTPGEVAAVVEVIYPVSDLKVSTRYVNKLMLVYFITSFIVLIVFLIWSYKHEEQWSE
ncbi:MAG: hypothetical protein QNJ56_06655 [Gammaproteobacteria bacterium]|nr:hypothetical protein [Gammaproteobacteria bacterium]